MTEDKIRNIQAYLSANPGTFFSDRYPEKKGRSKHKVFEEAEKEHGKYIVRKSAEFQKMMAGLRAIPSFLRIVTQNIHCRSTTPCINPLYSQCDGNYCFRDNQKERAEAFANLIIHGKTYADIVAIQELQDDTARQRFIDKILSTRNWKVIVDKDGAPYHIHKGVEIAGATLGLAAIAAIGAPMLPAIAKLQRDIDIARNVNSGLTIVYNSDKLELLEKEIYHFPFSYSSGADTITYKSSFKGVMYCRFQYKGTKHKISVYNFHPSPYVELKGKLHSESGLQIKISHMYQLTQVAMLIKKHMEEHAIIEGNKDTVITCGDININKYLQTGQIGSDALATDRRKGSENDNEACKRTAKMPTLFAQGECRDGEACFRDDVPNVSKKCDARCCGSEYLTMLEILQSIPPIHLQALPETDEDVVAPHGGKYTWDSLFNSVMYSPHWLTMSFQMIDGIFYSKYGHIPSYAHTMVRRFIVETPIEVNEGPLSAQCKCCQEKKDKTCEGNIKCLEPDRFAYVDKSTGKYNYYDVSDHYALECCMILNDVDDTIAAITAATTVALPLGNKTLGLRIWTDNFCNDYASKQVVMFPRRWLFSTHNSNIPNLTIFYLNYYDSRKHYPSFLSTIFKNISNPIAFADLQEFIPFYIEGPQNLIEYNKKKFDWKGYIPTLPTIRHFKTEEGKQYEKKKALEFHQYILKLINRMIERETINRKRDAIVGASNLILDEFVSPNSCDKNAYGCKTQKRPTSNSNNTRKNIIRSLNTGKYLTLKNAKNAVEKDPLRRSAMHTKRAEFKGELKSPLLYPGKISERKRTRKNII